MDWNAYAQGLLPGESRFVPYEVSKNSCDERCITGVVGLCLACETLWMMCGCGTFDFNCECGRKAELVDDYARTRMVRLEEAIRQHKQAKGDDPDEYDEALYEIFDEDIEG